MPDDATSPNGEGGDDAERRNLRPSRSTVLITVVVAISFGLVASTGDSASAVSRIALPSFVAIFLWLASVGIGRAALAAFGKLLGEPQVGDDLSTLLVLGYPLFGGLEFLVALVSTHSVALLIPAIAFAIPGALAIRDRRGSSRSAFPVSGSLFPSLLLTLLLLTSLSTALLPAVSLDEVSYHLAIPKIWIAEGSAVSLPLMSHSFFPLGTESADLAAIVLLGAEGAIASHLVHLFLAIAAVIVAIRALPETKLGALGVAAIASTPALLLSAGWTGTDVPLVAVSLGLFLFLDRFVRRGDGRAGIAASIAAGLLVKYTFLPVVLVLVGVAILHAEGRRKALLRAAVAGAVAGSVFFIRNLILTGNPVEPFFSGGGEIARFRWIGTWGETVTSYLFDTRFIDDSLGFVLPGLALAALALVRAIDPDWRRLAAVGMLLTGGILTFIGPAGRILLPFLVIPAWIALAALVSRKEAAGRVLASAVLVIAIAVQLGVGLLHLDRLDPLSVVAGRVEDRDWVAERRRSQESIVQGNELLDHGTRTLVLGVNELFWFDGRVTGGANFDSGRISEYLEGEGLAERLRNNDIGAVLVYPQNIRVGSEAGRAIERQRGLVLTPEAASALRRLLERSPMERRGGDAVLYRIRG